jgi:hypothetical protein
VKPEPEDRGNPFAPRPPPGVKPEAEDQGNPFAPPRAVERAPAKTLVADGLALGFGIFGLWTWSIVGTHADTDLLEGAVFSVTYYLPMAIAALVLGIGGVRRGRRPLLAWSGVVTGAIGILAVPAAVFSHFFA